MYGRVVTGADSFNILRDQYMADNVGRILQSLPDGEPIALWAHNLHVLADSSLWNARPLGRLLRETHGPRYYALATALGGGSFMACDIGDDAEPFWALARFAADSRLEEATLDRDLAGAVAQIDAPGFVVDLRTAPVTGPVARWLNEPRGLFTITSVYSPKWAAEYASYPVRLASFFDGVAFFGATTPARPLPLGHCPDQIYR